MMRLDFPDRTDQRNGYTWNAKLTSHDWTRMADFFFDVCIQKGDNVIRMFGASINDWMDGDVNCSESETEILEKILAEIHQQALEQLP